jgi:hypothetical protein
VTLRVVALGCGRARPHLTAYRAGAGLPRFMGCGVMRMRFVVLTVTPIAGQGAEGDRREPRPGRSEAVGVLDLNLDQASGLRSWLPHDRDSGRGQPGVLGVNIADLDPDHHRAPGRIGRVPGDLEQPWPRKNTSPGSSGGPNSR